MRKVGVPAIVVAVFPAILALSLVVAGGATASSELRFFTHDTQQTNLDLGETGDSVGDRYLFSGDVFDHRGGTKLGRLTGVCDTASRRAAGDGEDICLANLVLDRGQLTLSGTVDHAAFLGGTPQLISVTGGTATYHGARGDLTVTVLNATDTDTVVRLN